MEDGRPPLAFSVDLGKAQPEDVRFSRALALTHKLIAEHGPDVLAIEAPVGGPQTSHFLVGLVACVRGCAANRGVPVVRYSADAVRKHFLGRALKRRDFPGRSDKARSAALKAVVVDRCRALGWDVPDADAADACALADLALAKAGAQVAPSGRLFVGAA